MFVISGETGRLIDTIVAPDPGGEGNKANFAFPWVSRVGYNGDASSDLGSCPGGTSGQLCALPAIGPPDGVPDIIIGARGVDPRGPTTKDAGRSYVYDGVTRALLKRLDQPIEDATPLAIARAGGNWFGRVVLWPAGLPACEGNFGVGPCLPESGPGAMPKAVRNGDMDGGGRADIVISASVNSENSATAHPESPCAKSPGASCSAAGRVYIYRGEDIVGSSPREILDGAGPGETIRKIRNPLAQPDDLPGAENESMGNYMTPIGDVGTCTPAPPAPTEEKLCPSGSRRTSPDGKPEVVLGLAGVDLPLNNPDPATLDVGAAALIDGATGTVLHIYHHPEPQAAGRFGTPNHHEPASGDLGDTGLPDVALPAPNQHAGAHSAGREYIMNGNYLGGTGRIVFAILDDPTPNIGENFGGSSAGVGDLVGGVANPRNELLLGGVGPFLGASNRDVINDVHFFNAANERVLQTIPDPDQQPGAGFGESIVPLGDLNEDTFLDFMVGGSQYSGSRGIGEGRMYIFRSNNRPLPPAPARPAAQVTTPKILRPGSCVNETVGTAGNDALKGTTAGDRMFGFGGNDRIEGFQSPDCLDGGAGLDRLLGGIDRDRLIGGSGIDRLSGGNDRDRLFGGSGRDRLRGGYGPDVLAGGTGNDRLDGGPHTDKVYGERGNDRIRSGGGRNLLDGGSGNDVIYARNDRRDVVSCGSGRDRVVADRTDIARAGCERVSRGKRRARISRSVR